ncbi:MAG: hypothetical protein IJ225_07310 [Solobacterium sp.]|nr:hypothetical protein [Solobacterium sp.]
MGKGLGKGLKLSPKAVISALALPLALAVSLKLSSPLWITVYAEETEAITEVSSEENKSESVQDSSSDSSAVTEVNESSDTGDHSDEQIIVDNQDPFTVDSIPADTGYYTDPVSYDDQYVPVDNSGGQSEYAGETGGSYEVLILEPSSDETGNVIASEGSNETDEDATDTIIGNAEGSGEDDPDEEVIEDKDTDSTDPATSITPTDAESDEPKTESDPGETTNEVNDDSVGQGVAQSNQVTFTAAASAPAVTAAASTTEDSLLQKKITNALQENEDSNHQISGVVQIVLDKETSYEGDVEVSYGETGKYSAYTFADDFELELIAEDAGGDGLKADKMTTFKGKMKIVNLHVSMKGINVPGTVEVSGEKGLFDYIGTYLFDTINVVVTDGAKANIDTGDLDDTVTVSVNTNGTADIITGEGDDEIKVTAEDGGTVTIDSGNDIDTITATIGTNGTLIIDSGDGDDIVTLKIKESGNATVSTGDGNDQFTIEKSGSVIDENPGNKVTVSLGEGTNSATVNISIADLIKDIEFNSSATSSDSIHFLGTLKSKSDSDPEDYVAISGTSMDHLVFTNNNKKKLNVTTSNIKVMTDALGNKQKKTLTSKTSDYTYTEADQPFTDYVVTMPSADLGDVVITSKDNQQLLLSSVIINTDSVKVTDNKVTIEKGKTVEVHGLNLILRGREFDIKGKIKADYLRIEASDGTGAHGRSFSDLYSGYNEAENAVSAAIDAGLDMAAELINVSNDAGILIDSDAEIYSAGDVVLSAQVNQNSGMISFLSGINVVNVKVAKAGIDIKGKIFAGWDFSNDTWNKGSYGSVIADAKINTSIGYDTDGKEESGMPLAISVGIADAYINIEQGAEVYAARDIWLNSKSELKIHTRADSGILSSTAPVALGVAVLNNDSNVFVDGTLVAGGNIHATALGNTKAKTISDKGESHDNESGGFFGVSVVLQDVAAELGSHADVNADGSVAVVSKASENIENRAASSTQSIDKKKDDGVLSQVKDMGIKLLTDKVLPWVKEKIREKWLGADSVKMEKLVKAIDKVASSDRSVQIDDDAQSHGEVKVNIENSEASGVSSSTASITITPNSGYQVKKVYVRLYNPGDNSYETKDVPLATDNTYNFLFNKQNAILFVEYEEKDEELNLDELDVFDNSSSSSSDSDIDLQDLIDNINEEDQTSSYHKILNDSADDSELIKLELSGDGGALLNYETDPNDQNKSYLKAAPGQVLRLIPNPNTNKTLKQGGLTATYKIKENDKDVTKTVIINPNDKGRYIFEIPENILVSEGLKFKAVFVDNGNADAEANTTQTQITGAIAVVVAENDSHAVIASDAKVVAAGGVTVNSNVKTVVSNLADGTAVSKTSSSEGTKDDTNYAIKRDSEKTYSGFDAPGYQYGLVLENSGNGNVSYQAVDHVNNAYTFTITPNDGYSVSSVTLVYYQGGDRKTEVLSAGEDGKYTVNLNSIASILSALDK